MADETNSRGQVKDDQGAEGRLMSHEQDVGELSAQNRGGTTQRGAEETKRLEEDDREQAQAAHDAARAQEKELSRKLDPDGQCE